MNKYKIIILINCIFLFLLGILAYFKYLPEDSKFTQFKNPPQISKHSPEDKKITKVNKEKIDPIKIPVVSDEKKDNGDLERELRKLKRLKNELQSIDSECLLAFRKLIPEDDYVDVGISFYKGSSNVTKMSLDVIANTFAKEDWRYISVFEDLIASDADFDPQWAFHEMNQIDSCRPSEGINFIDTALEAARFHKWSRKEKKELIAAILKPFLALQKGYYTSNDIVFFVGYLRKLLAQRLISTRFKNNVDTIMDKLMAEKQDYLRAKQERKNIDFLRKDFRRYYFGIKDLGAEVAQLCKEIIHDDENY